MTIPESYCGSPCEGCGILLATLETDKAKQLEMRREIAATIENVYGGKCAPEDVADCFGCKGEPLSKYAGQCPIRACVVEKGLESCELCGEYPCAEIKKLAEQEEKAKGE